MIPIQDTIPSRSFPVITWALILLNTLIFALEASLSPAELERLVYAFGVIPARYTHPAWAVSMGLTPNAWWPFLSNMFLHGGLLHLAGNMWSLYIFGDNVEDRMGRGRFLVFYLLTGVAASLLHIAVNPDSTMPAIGASGAISGVMGAYMFLFPRARIIFLIPLLFIPYFVEISAFFYLALWFWGQFISGTASSVMAQNAGGIAFWAHVGGFVAGALLYRFFIRGRPKAYYADEYYKRYIHSQT